MKKIGRSKKKTEEKAKAGSISLPPWVWDLLDFEAKKKEKDSRSSLILEGLKLRFKKEFFEKSQKKLF